MLDAHRKRVHNGEWTGPPAKRNAPSISSLQRDLQQERERHRRSQESVEQLRLEMQMMGRVLAAAREQIVKLGGATMSPDVMLRVPPNAQTSSRTGRSRSDAKALQRLQNELSENKGECKRLNEQVCSLQNKLQAVLACKQDLLSILSDMQERFDC
eukprot:CAMPEP_0119311076 /NCGR_PEP_ID=MMETSP1333-20130426/21551_1 /TAXON_ID=418940 /ORGANISM="Scyphosphaera apsteinii, Strain RCC1455" /LENGTH=155 /DNA_ID=CAMNT_0007315377 /DNA_START=6 /DNA_END=473 /DNA_ORIENTATION=-